MADPRSVPCPACRARVGLSCFDGEGYLKAYCSERMASAEEHRAYLTKGRELYDSKLVIFNALARYEPADIHRIATFIREMDAWGAVEDLTKSSADGS